MKLIRIQNNGFIAEGTVTPEHRLHADWVIWENDGYCDDESTPVKGEKFADGFVKWDGCSNWSFCRDNGMFHGCERRDLELIGEILARCWDASAELIGEPWCVD